MNFKKAFLLFLLLAPSAKAETFFVNTNEDLHDGSLADGICDTDLTDGEVITCSLRAAVEQVVSIRGEGHEIYLEADTYCLTRDIFLNGSTTEISIIGTGIDQTIIDGGNGSDATCSPSGEELFYIFSRVKANFKNLSLQGGSHSSYGGALYITTASSVVLDQVKVSHNLAKYGGGIYLTDSSLTIQNESLIQNNTAETFGGGIYSKESNLQISQSEVSSNSALTGGGVWVYDNDSTTLTGVTLSFNQAEQHGGGGIFMVTSDLEIENSFIFSNQASYGSGLYLDGSQGTIDSSEIFENDSPSHRAISISSPSRSLTSEITITNTLVYDNKGKGIGVTDYSLLTLDQSIVTGNSEGGIYTFSGADVTISNSEISYNTSYNGAGLYSYGSEDVISISNSTFYGNAATGRGGGVLFSGKLLISSSTIYGNTAGEYAGGIYPRTRDSEVYFKHSIINGNTASSVATNNCWGISDSVISYGYNWIDSKFCYITGYRLKYSSKPDIKTTLDSSLFGDFDYDESSTRIVDLLSGNPALDSGDCFGLKFSDSSRVEEVTLVEDQRGVERPSSDCDLGAYEKILAESDTSGDSTSGDSSTVGESSGGDSSSTGEGSTSGEESTTSGEATTTGEETTGGDSSSAGEGSGSTENGTTDGTTESSTTGEEGSLSSSTSSDGSEQSDGSDTSDETNTTTSGETSAGDPNLPTPLPSNEASNPSLVGSCSFKVNE